MRDGGGSRRERSRSSGHLVMIVCPALEDVGYSVLLGEGERKQSNGGRLAAGDASDREQSKNQEQLKSGGPEPQAWQPLAERLGSSVLDCGLAEWIASRMEMLVAEARRMSLPKRVAIEKGALALGLEARFEVRPTIRELLS